MSVVNHAAPNAPPALIRAQLTEVQRDVSEPSRSTNMSTRPFRKSQGVPKANRSSALVAASKEKGAGWHAGLQLSLFGKLYSIKLNMSLQGFNLYPTFQARNIVPLNSDMAKACKAGDFAMVRSLLTNGLARGSDVTPRGWPMLDVRSHCPLFRLVRVLITRTVCNRKRVCSACASIT
jgi:hypothetical protein